MRLRKWPSIGKGSKSKTSPFLIIYTLILFIFLTFLFHYDLRFSEEGGVHNSYMAEFLEIRRKMLFDVRWWRDNVSYVWENIFSQFIIFIIICSSMTFIFVTIFYYYYYCITTIILLFTFIIILLILDIIIPLHVVYMLENKYWKQMTS